mgnify:CR=1 FL=1
MNFLNNSLIKLIFSNHLLKIISGGVNFGIIALIANLTNSEVLGEFTTIYAIIILISGLAFWGFADGFVILKSKFGLKELTMNCLLVCGINIFLAFIFVFTVFFKFKSSTKLLICLIVCSVILHNLVSSILRVIKNYNSSIYFSSIQVNFIFCVILFINNLLNFNLNIYTILISYLLSHVISLICVFCYLFSIKIQNHFDSDEKTVSSSTIIFLYKHNTPLVISDVLNNFIGTLDILILNKFLSFSEIANYKVATAFGKLIKVSLSSFSNFMLPELSKMIKEKSGDVFLYIKNNYKYIFIIALVMTLSVSFFGELLIELLFGDEYEIAYPLLLMLLIGYSFNNFSGPNGTILLSLGKLKDLLKIDILTNFIGVFLLYILTWKYAIWGSVIANVLLVVIYNLMKNRKLRVLMPEYNSIVKRIYFAWGVTILLIVIMFISVDYV